MLKRGRRQSPGPEEKEKLQPVAGHSTQPWLPLEQLSGILLPPAPAGGGGESSAAPDLQLELLLNSGQMFSGGQTVGSEPT